MRALRVGVIAAEEGWCDAFSRATFHDWFVGKRAPGVDGHTENTLVALDRSPGPLIARATGEEGEDLLRNVTDAARALGIFGAPTFAVEREIFWGDDRLEDALALAASS